MRLLCRLGWHKWGVWSKMWHQTTTIYDGSTRYLLMRSLKCSCCGFTKDKQYDGKWYVSISNACKSVNPVWEETTRESFKPRLIQGGKK